MVRHTETGLVGTLAFFAFIDSHPLVYKLVSAFLVAVVSTLASHATQRLFPKKKQ